MAEMPVATAHPSNGSRIVAKRRQTVCSECGAPTTRSIQTKEIPGRRYLCMRVECAEAYERERHRAGKSRQ